MNSWISPFLFHKTSQFYQKINLCKNESKNFERPQECEEILAEKKECDCIFCQQSSKIEMRGQSIGNNSELSGIKNNSRFKASTSVYMESKYLYNTKAISKEGKGKAESFEVLKKPKIINFLKKNSRSRKNNKPANKMNFSNMYMESSIPKDSLKVSQRSISSRRIHNTNLDNSSKDLQETIHDPLVADKVETKLLKIMPTTVSSVYKNSFSNFKRSSSNDFNTKSEYILNDSNNPRKITEEKRSSQPLEMISKAANESEDVSPTKESEVNSFSFNPIYMARRKASQKLKRKVRK